MRKIVIYFLLLIGCSPLLAQKQSLRVADNGHYLQYEDGKPFFWLGDTAWELFHRLTVEEIKMYLDNRRDKGFNVIQAVIIAEFDGLRTPNRYGDLPLIELNPDRPNEKYFQLVDTVIKLAKERELIIALLPTWGDKVTAHFGGGPAVFTVDNAYTYGHYLGERYKNDANIVWVLGGDRPPKYDKEDLRPIWGAMAKGIKEGSGKRDLMTFHPGGSIWHTSEHLHQTNWLDFNMIQSGHGDIDIEVWKFVARDWSLKPTKPVIDAEPCYEDHPVNPWPTWDPARGYFRDYSVRKQLYRSVFAGGAGVTYGNHCIWQACQPQYDKINYAEFYWYDAVDRPGAFQAGFLRKLIESRPYMDRIPDQSIILTPQDDKSEYITAFRDGQNRYMMVYLPVGKELTVKTSAISSEKIRGWWFNPKNMKVKSIGLVKNKGSLTASPPTIGAENDWVLVLDDPSQKFVIPGKQTK